MEAFEKTSKTRTRTLAAALERVSFYVVQTTFMPIDHFM